MMQYMSKGDQKGIIFDPFDEENTKVPTMPLLIMLDNGVIGEAKTIRGAMALIVGSEYLDAEDGLTEWHMRVNQARKEAMKALERGIDAVVYDTRQGIIENNYAAAPGDPDYENDNSVDFSNKILVDNDRVFILSLIKIGAVKVLERSDSYMLRPHQKWELIAESNGALQTCSTCLFGKEEGSDIFCPVFNEVTKKSDGSGCGSFTIRLNDYKEEYKGGEYIELSQEYDINDLIEQVGQKWIIKDAN